MAEFVQAYVVSAPVFAVKAAGLIEAVGQTLISDKAVMTGVGLIVTVKVTGALAQPLAVAVTEIVAEILKLVRFAGAAYEAIFPVPLVAKPIAALLLVQLKVAPATLLPNAPGLIELVGQTIMLETAVTTGVGLTEIEKFIGELIQLFNVAVTAIFPTNADPETFTGAT